MKPEPNAVCSFGLAAVPSPTWFSNQVPAQRSPDPLSSLPQKFAFLQEVSVAFSHHLLFGEFGHQEPAGIRFRATILNQAQVVSADNSICRFGSLAYAMNLLHAECHVCPWSVFDRFDGADPKLRDDSVLLDSADRVLVPKFADRICPQVCGHHVQRSREVLIDCRRRVSQVMFKEAPDNRLGLKLGRSSVGGRLSS